MKKILLNAFLLGSILTTQAQTVLFEDSFETYNNFAIANVGNWTLRDLDEANYNYTIINYSFTNEGVIPSYIVFNPNNVTIAEDAPAQTLPFSNEGNQAKTGNKYMAAFASYNIVNGQAVPVTQSDWLISPQITLGETGNIVTFWAKSYTTQYGSERFKVLISNTNTEAASFTAISTGNYIEAANTTWTEYAYNIPATYNLQNVYIAIQCVSNDSFIFMVDDFKVTTTPTASNDEFFKNNFTIYPNPTTDELNITTVNGLELNEISIFDLTGRKVKSFKNEKTLNVSDLASGTYIINIKTNEGTGTSKFIKK